MVIHPDNAPEKVLVIRKPNEPSRRYHIPERNCHHARKGEGRVITFEEAKKNGYSPCRRCFPNLD